MLPQNYQSLSCDFIVKLEFERAVKKLQETRDTVLARRYYELFNEMIDMRYDVASDHSEYLFFLHQKIEQRYSEEVGIINGRLEAIYNSYESMLQVLGTRHCNVPKFASFSKEKILNSVDVTSCKLSPKNS